MKRSGLPAVACLLLTGCVTGLIYEDIVEPLTTNFHDTPSGIGRAGGAEGDVKHIRYQVEVAWDSNAIGDIAKRSGIGTIYYADLETLSVLGIWNQEIVHVYGK